MSAPRFPKTRCSTSKAPRRGTRGCARHDSNMRPLPPQGRRAVGDGWTRLEEPGSKSALSPTYGEDVRSFREAIFWLMDTFRTLRCLIRKRPDGRQLPQRRAED